MKISRADLEWSFVILGLLSLAFFLQFQLWGDGFLRFDMLNALYSKGQVSKLFYSFMGPLFASPLWAIGKTQYYNFLLFVMFCVALFFYFRKAATEERSIVRRFLIILILASMFPYPLTSFYGEPFSVLTMAFGLLLMLDRYEKLGFVFCIVSVTNTPATLPAFGLVMATLAFLRKRWRFFVPAGLALICIMIENTIRRGHPLESGYLGTAGFKTIDPYSGQPGFSYPFILGVISILFSFGKGIFFFMPGLSLPVLQKNDSSLRSLYRLGTIFVVGLVLFYSKWWSWYGGSYWGPRFFLFATIPASLAIAYGLENVEKNSLRMNWILLAVLTASFWVGFSSATASTMEPSVCFDNYYYLHVLCRYVPEYSLLWNPVGNTGGGHPYESTHFAIRFFAWIFLASPLAKNIMKQTRQKFPRPKFAVWKY